jgi:riboflavin kinase/FMN adenylyltransferase
MLHVHELSAVQLEKSWVTIGTFDGVHLGHQQIIRKLVEGAGAADLTAGLITFFPHPQLVLQNESRPFYLTLPDFRARILGQLGVEVVLTYPFDHHTSQLSAREFIGMLHDRFQFENLLIGYDFALGKDREGTSQVLRQIGKEIGYTVQEIPPFRLNGELVSSSRIRGLLREGKIAQVSTLLGRYFAITGVVVAGDDRGKSLGFATSNLEVHPELVDIKSGVYVCWASVGGKTWQAVTNIGVRPTFGEDLEAPRIESHLLDFSDDLYGKEIELSFVKRLRDERKFEQVEDLITQISSDVKQTREILNGK